MIRHLVSLTILLFSITLQASEKLTPCYIIYDAGSSGTRLYIYRKHHQHWVAHKGPKVAALADPVREIRGKTWADADAVTTEIVAALDNIQKKGGKWKAFDWTNRCRLIAANIYATAGMRIAEQKDRERSIKLWQMLKQKLAIKLGNQVKIETRTLSGYEEGLYAWLAVREDKQTNHFGIAEMGGASAQITFPCPECDMQDDAVKNVIVAGQLLPIYSYSFLGLGQDEILQRLEDFPTACAYGIATTRIDWQKEDCANQITLNHQHGIYDPYNFKDNMRGIYATLPEQHQNIAQWVLTGAFNHMHPNDIETCCLNKGQCYHEATACFNAIYLEKYLQTLHIPIASEKIDVNWTRGALICTLNQCLQKNTTSPICRWSKEGCL